MQIGLGGQTTVTATERWLSELRAGRAFTGGSTFGASVGNYSHVQLFNPVGSTITVIVRSILISLGAATWYDLRVHGTQLTGDSGAGTNLLVGGAAGQAHIRTQLDAGKFGTLVYSLAVLASQPYDPVREWAFELGAGEGILIVPNIVNTECDAAYTWIEV